MSPLGCLVSARSSLLNSTRTKCLLLPSCAAGPSHSSNTCGHAVHAQLAHFLEWVRSQMQGYLQQRRRSISLRRCKDNPDALTTLDTYSGQSWRWTPSVARTGMMVVSWPE